jgi:ribosome-binding ATPase YchF (GTP1/OBG family)
MDDQEGRHRTQAAGVIHNEVERGFIEAGWCLSRI